MHTVVVVPCYNESRRLGIERFLAFCRSHPDIDFLFVNDGSTDDTGPLLEALCVREPQRFRVLHLRQNSGKAEAVRQGMLLAMESGTGAAGYWDADLATPLDAIPRAVEVLRENPDVCIVLGTRLELLGHRIERKWLRSRLGTLFSWCASCVIGLRVRDTQCGAKLFRVEDATRRLFRDPFLSRWIFDVELLVRWVRSCRASRAFTPGAHLYEMPLEQWNEVAGSKLRGRDFLRAIGELWSIWWNAGSGTRAVPQESSATTL